MIGFQVRSKRNDLKIVIMSATINTEKYQKFFGNDSNSLIPVLEIPGRTFPIDHLFPAEAIQDQSTAIIDKVLEIHQSKEQGDILVFAVGEKEVESWCEKVREGYEGLLEEGKVGPLEVYPLYSAVSDAMAVFVESPRGTEERPGRKVIISTNVAETSLTLDGIAFVIDNGKSNQKGYNLVNGEYLAVANITRFSANQRAGRAGRTRPGTCYHMYTEHWYNSVREDKVPDTQSSDLTSVCLLKQSLTPMPTS